MTTIITKKFKNNIEIIADRKISYEDDATQSGERNKLISAFDNNVIIGFAGNAIYHYSLEKTLKAIKNNSLIVTFKSFKDLIKQAYKNVETFCFIENILLPSFSALAVINKKKAYKIYLNKKNKIKYKKIKFIDLVGTGAEYAREYILNNKDMNIYNAMQYAMQKDEATGAGYDRIVIEEGNLMYKGVSYGSKANNIWRK